MGKKLKNNGEERVKNGWKIGENWVKNGGKSGDLGQKNGKKYGDFWGKWEKIGEK